MKGNRDKPIEHSSALPGIMRVMLLPPTRAQTRKRTSSDPCTIGCSSAHITLLTKERKSKSQGNHYCMYVTAHCSNYEKALKSLLTLSKCYSKN